MEDTAPPVEDSQPAQQDQNLFEGQPDFEQDLNKAFDSLFEGLTQIPAPGPERPQVLGAVSLPDWFQYPFFGTCYRASAIKVPCGA